VNVTNPESPTLEGSVSSGDGNKIDKQDDFVYIVDGDSNTLNIINVSDPANPNQEVQYSTQTILFNLELEGGYVYLCEAAGLTTVSNANLSSITFMGRYETGGIAKHAKIIGNTTYVGGSAGFNIINISDPSSPELLGSYITSESVRALSIMGDYVYIILASKLIVLDISNPQVPTLVSENNSIGHTVDVFTTGDYAYLTHGNHGLSIYNIQDPYDVYKVGELGLGNAQKLVVEGSYAYLACGPEGLKIVDVSDPANPVQINQWNVSHPDWPPDELGYINTVQVQDEYLYVGERGSVFSILDASDPQSLELLGDSYFPSASMDVEGDYAFLCSGRDVIIINLTDPTNIKESGFIYGDVYSLEVDVSGSIFTVAYGGAGLKIYEFTGNDVEIEISFTTDKTDILDTETANVTLRVTQSGAPFPGMEVRMAMTGECTVEPMEGFTDENGELKCLVTPQNNLDQSLTINAVVYLDEHNIGDLQTLYINVSTDDGGNGGDGGNGDSLEEGDSSPLGGSMLWLLMMLIIPIVVVLIVVILMRSRKMK
jgi:hypothetical protein